MDHGKAHHLLAQIPLTVSPFVQFPKATNLSYNWKPLPSTLPPSTAGEDSKSKYVVSQSGHAAHPDDIIASCQALQSHTTKLQTDAEQTLTRWKAEIHDRELAEKRRVAPGWLDREEKILQPVRKGTDSRGESLMDAPAGKDTAGTSTIPPVYDEGADIDRTFGSLGLQ